MRPNGSHIQAAILRAITAQAGLGNLNRQKAILIVENIRSDDWASATFVGATHALELRIEGAAQTVAAAAAALHDGLAECDIPIAGHIAAEVEVILGKYTNIIDNMISISLTVNALTIID